MPMKWLTSALFPPAELVELSCCLRWRMGVGSRRLGEIGLLDMYSGSDKDGDHTPASCNCRSNLDGSIGCVDLCRSVTRPVPLKMPSEESTQ